MSTATTETDAPSGDTGRLDLRRPRGSRTFVNGLVTVLVCLCAALAVVPLVWILWSVIAQGAHLIVSPEWWSHDQLGKTPRRAGGGALHAMVGTVLIGLLVAIIAVPIGILGAIFLIEYARGTRAAKVVSFTVDILTGIPSIVAALFVYAMLITTFGMNRSALAAALSLVLLMLPTVLRSTEEMLKLVPDSLREASYALGVPKWKTIVKVIIPTAFGGIATGIVLGLARVMGETAPLLILVAYGTTLTFDILNPVMPTLPTMINSGRDQAEKFPGYQRVWGAALTLIIIVMGLNLLARLISRLSKLKEK